MTVPQEPSDIRQVLVHPAIWSDLEAWLAARGITLVHLPMESEGDDLPTYFMGLPDERVREVFGGSREGRREPHP